MWSALWSRWLTGLKPHTCHGGCAVVGGGSKVLTAGCGRESG